MAKKPGTRAEFVLFDVFYEDGTNSNNVLVTTDLGLANKGQPLSFMVSGGGKMIDAIQLTMAYGEIKVPEIRFTTLVERLANDVKLDFSATLICPRVRRMRVAQALTR